jgi:hypothetical protein
MSSLVDFTGTEGCATSTTGMVLVWTTGAKSLIGSNGTLFRIGLMLSVLAVAIASV